MAKLITASEVISKAFTNANTDTALIKDSFIEIAQRNHLKPVIGDELYNRIINEKEANVTWSVSGGGITAAGSNAISNYMSLNAFAPVDINWFVSMAGFIPRYRDSYDYTDGETNYHTRVLTKTDANNITVSANATNTTAGAAISLYSPFGYLVDNYIKDFLAFAVKFEAMPDMTYNSTSQGIVENIADFTTPVSSKKLSFLRNEVYKQAQTYKRRMVEFLEAEDIAYVLYKRDDESTTKRNGIIMY